MYEILNESRSHLRNVRSLNESFASKLLQRLAQSHQGIKGINPPHANSRYYIYDTKPPIHMYSDQQIAAGILCTPYPNMKFFDFDGQDWTIPSRRIHTSDIDFEIDFNDGYCLIIPFTKETRPTQQQQDYYSANKYGGQKKLDQSNKYNRFGSNRYGVGYKNGVLYAQQDKRDAQERERKRTAWQYRK